MGLTAYLSIELSCSFSHWFTPKASQLILEPLQYLCHHPQEPVYVSLPLDTHPFMFLRYRDYIPDTPSSRAGCAECRTELQGCSKTLTAQGVLGGEGGVLLGRGQWPH